MKSDIRIHDVLSFLVGMLHACMYVCTYVYVCMYVCMYVCIYVYLQLGLASAACTMQFYMLCTTFPHDLCNTILYSHM